MPDEENSLKEFFEQIKKGKSFDEIDTGIDAIVNKHVILNGKDIGVVEVMPWADENYGGMHGIYFNSSEDAGRFFSAKDSRKIKVGRKNLTVGEFKKEYLSGKKLSIYVDKKILQEHRKEYDAQVKSRKALQRQFDKDYENSKRADEIYYEAVRNGWQ